MNFPAIPSSPTVKERAFGLLERFFEQWNLAKLWERGWAVGWVLVYFFTFDVSGRLPPNSILDPSWQVALEHASAHGWQFGTDVIFTYGPLGYLAMGHSLGFMAFERVLFALLWSGLVAGIATDLTLRIKGPLRMIFILWVATKTGFEEQILLVLGYAGLLLLDERRNYGRLGLLFVPLLAALGLVKFTAMLAGGAIVAIGCAVLVIRRLYLPALSLALCFGLSLPAVWWLCGQNSSNLIPFLVDSWQVASGYSAAMNLPAETRHLLLYGLQPWVLFLAVGARIGFLNRRTPAGLAGLVILFLLVFLAWKHGFIRADPGHIIHFTQFLPVAFGMLLAGHAASRISRREYCAYGVVFFAATLSCYFSTRLPQETGLSPGQRLQLFTRAITGDFAHIFPSVAEAQKAYDLGEARTMIGRHTVDMFTQSQGVLLFNGLNYHPRPAIQSYTAYTPALQERDLEFYQSNQRPDFVLMKLETLDGRYAMLNDALLMPYLFHNYRPLAKDDNYLLLQRLPVPPDPLEFKLLLEGDLKAGDQVNFSRIQAKHIFLQVEWKTSLWGKIVGFCYQPAPIRIDFEMEDKTSTPRRFVPRMAERGVLVSPMVENNDDLVHLWAGDNPKRVQRLSISTFDGQNSQYAPTLHVRILAAPDFLKLPGHPAAGRTGPASEPPPFLK